MAKPSKLKIDVTKILKEHLYKGAKGTYLNCVIWPNKDGPDEYGNTHSIKQELSREARDAGEKEPFIGNMTLVEAEDSRSSRQPGRSPTTGSTYKGKNAYVPPVDDGQDDDPIPF